MTTCLAYLTLLLKPRRNQPTPPVFQVYVAGLALKWLKEKGGVAGIEALNQEKSKLLYDCLAESKNFESKVDPDSRSIMNVPFVSGDPDLDAEFVKEATAHQLLNIERTPPVWRDAGKHLQRHAAGRGSGPL